MADAGQRTMDVEGRKGHTRSEQEQLCLSNALRAPATCVQQAYKLPAQASATGRGRCRGAEGPPPPSVPSGLPVAETGCPRLCVS